MNEIFIEGQPGEINASENAHIFIHTQTFINMYILTPNSYKLSESGRFPENRQSGNPVEWFGWW